MMIAMLAFWLSVLLILYSYLGYPLLMHLWSLRRSPPSRRAIIPPSVSILLVVNNEGPRIGRRIRNLLSLYYPRTQLEILVGSDGSTDDTVERAMHQGNGVVVVAYQRRRGKSAVLNDLVRRARGEILVLTDARQTFAADALIQLIRNFGDPAVGAVSGALILTTRPHSEAVGEGVGFYWRYEKLIRSAESRVDSTVGATGAIYAIRRELYEPLREDTLLDDVVVPMTIAKKGYRVLFDAEARAYDRASRSASEELARKIRTIAGNFQLFFRDPLLLSPLHNRLWFQTISHKALRLLVPALMAAAFVANLMLLTIPAYRWVLAGQLVFYALALAGLRQRALRGDAVASRRSLALAVPYTVCLLNWAVVVAFVRFLAGTQSAAWDRVTARPIHQRSSPPRVIGTR